MSRRRQFCSDTLKTLYELGKYEEALARCQGFLADVRSRDARHLEIPDLLTSLAHIERYAGHLDKAIAAMHEALAFDLAAEGEFSQHTIQSISFLAYLNVVAKNYELAEPLVRRGLAALDQLPIEEQYERFLFLINLARIHSFRSQLREAELRMLEAARLVGRGQGWWTSDFGLIYEELADIYVQQGKLVAAKRTLEKAVRTMEYHERARWEEIAYGRMRFQLGRVHQWLNELAEARHCFAASLAVFQNLQPLDNPSRVRCEEFCSRQLADLEEALVTMP